MALSDFTAVAGGLAIGSAVIVKPSGGLGASPDPGSFLLAAGTVGSAAGTWAMWTNQAGFDPAPKGGTAAAILRSGAPPGIVGAIPGASPFVFACAEPAAYDVGDPPEPLPAPTATSVAYLAGLAVEEGGARVVLVKGRLGDGLPSAPAGELGVIARGSVLHAPQAWVHVRLQAVWNTTGDVALQVKQSDLALHPPSAPVWEPVPGIELLIDDVLGARTGTPALPSIVGGVGGGFFGIGGQHTALRSVACFDRVALERQA